MHVAERIGMWASVIAVAGSITAMGVAYGEQKQKVVTLEQSVASFTDIQKNMNETTTQIQIQSARTEVQLESMREYLDEIYELISKQRDNGGG